MNLRYYKSNILPELYVVNEEENSYLFINIPANVVRRVNSYWKQFVRNGENVPGGMLTELS